MISIILADDHALIREGLKKVLSQENDIDVIYEAENAQQVLDFLVKNNANLLILDINLPGMSGLDALKYIQKLAPDLKVLMLSMYPEDRFAVRALKSGAAGYLTKSSAAEELVTAIRKIVLGNRYLSSAATEILLREISGSTDKLLHETLSEREFQVMLFLVQGKSVKEISQDLVLSLNTINTYRARVLNKMKVKTVQELIRYAYDQRLLE
ncbi:DNA-binding response regulator [Leptospira kmetyi]|uniref:DNA-binding response regulator n=1 Tax=Leptospira kmetyi TaxID=408139 RepID=A0A2M9XW27_9LEPT|nr:response regulator transcription factor [Leptospira kmetyi]AYV56801.1 DNA-binding response regulator [Leptospira kmetyi]EQA53250.1 response regulator receiver domain protein [Leptospira kmetyi serovar Malaysia str. Bejo-Iso9]PJZ43529.1 DNA-binding response regulator [Leptospira kmetyi]TGK18371.1 DNA-binding response regulator [Leptospira kmetyi]TGK26752.1 DNA-binding response regulator [Leptospira kmetyi]